MNTRSKEYIEGADAFVAGKTIDQNPWDGTKAGASRQAADDWDKGWKDTRDALGVESIPPLPNARFSMDVPLRNWIAQEIRLAMQQEVEMMALSDGTSGLYRAGIAEVRASRILGKMDNMPLSGLTKVPEEIITSTIKQFLSQGN